MNQEKIKHLSKTLRETIMELIHEFSITDKLWQPTTQEWMADVLADSVIRRLTKFAKGQREHGGDFLTKDMQVVSMMQEEADDSFWYFERFKNDVQKFLTKHNADKK